MADAALKVSFQSKEEIHCPACGNAFHREELLSGSGRLIAGKLTDELHRLYEPSAKYGDVYPLAYTVTVCPSCFFASDARDFTGLPNASRDKAAADEEKRKESLAEAFGEVDFTAPRSLVSGAASHYLAVRCYDFYTKEFSPTIKQGITSLRAGWLLDDMNKKMPGQHYDWLALLFKKKAMFFYDEAVKREASGKETLSGLKNFGPDTDKNYGYEGALYLSALLKYKYAYLDNPAQRTELLGEAKRTIAKMFGSGKSSKSKPGPMLENARALYDNLAKELHETDE